VTLELRKSPCASCPYRKNVPSGVWEAVEYGKLPGYDGETYEQENAKVFSCHQDDGTVCAGWLGHRDPADLLAVRIGISSGRLPREAVEYTTDVPLFETGDQAAEHGMREIEHPSEEAIAMSEKIVKKRGL
jgi:hypothetical protein